MTQLAYAAGTKITAANKTKNGARQYAALFIYSHTHKHIIFVPELYGLAGRLYLSSYLVSLLGNAGITPDKSKTIFQAGLPLALWQQINSGMVL